MDKYFIKSLPKGMSVVEAEELVGKIVTALFKAKLYPSYRFIDYVINNLSENEILDTIKSYVKGGLISIYDTEVLDHEVSIVPENIIYFSPQFPNEIGNIEIDICKLSHILELKPVRNYYKYILKNIMVPTMYLTPMGNILMDYDIDAFGYYMKHLYDGCTLPCHEHITHIIVTQLNEMSEIYFLRYFNLPY